MPHCLILGMTESGKTTLAREMSKIYRANGVETVVLDPLLDPRWDASFITRDPDEFLRVYWSSRSCAVFIDEAADSVGRFDTAMIQTATKGRHWGHNNHYLSQRGAALSRTVRDQCSRLFLFTVAYEDAKTLAREFNKPQLLQAPSMPAGTYWDCGRFSPARKGKVF